ncbi:hypothetical protein C8035_v003178 [Colletotrichum spinosum]|uniref:Uncharacterized protein n=1 Tax=Colletotrichum spinosum TaxID=1347390 RepID=A0A4R8PWE4_9PEZI|nr:hypothetical protein C8035_v003178 [Colletotrichum spinosum]
MRFIALATLLSLAAALPAAVTPEQTTASLASRDTTTGAALAVEANILARGGNSVDRTYDWPADAVWWGSTGVQFEVTNIGWGKYRFDFWNSGPSNGGSWKFRVSNAGNTLAERTVAPHGSASVELAQTGSNFNIYVESV